MKLCLGLFCKTPMNSNVSSKQEDQSYLFHPSTCTSLTLDWALMKDCRLCFRTYRLTDLSEASLWAAFVICFWSSSSNCSLPLRSSSFNIDKSSDNRKILKTFGHQNNCCNHPKLWTVWLYHRVTSPKDGTANSVDSDQTALGLHCPQGAVWSILFAQAYPLIITVPKTQRYFMWRL